MSFFYNLSVYRLHETCVSGVMSEFETNDSLQVSQLSTLYTFFAYHVNVFLYYTVRCGTSKPYGLTRRKVIIIPTFLYPPQYIMVLLFQAARNIQMLYLPSTGVSNNTFQMKMRYCGYKFIWLKNLFLKLILQMYFHQIRSITDMPLNPTLPNILSSMYFQVSQVRLEPPRIL